MSALDDAKEKLCVCLGSSLPGSRELTFGLLFRQFVCPLLSTLEFEIKLACLFVYVSLFVCLLAGYVRSCSRDLRFGGASPGGALIRILIASLAEFSRQSALDTRDWRRAPGAKFIGFRMALAGSISRRDSGAVAQWESVLKAMGGCASVRAANVTLLLMLALMMRIYK